MISESDIAWPSLILSPQGRFIASLEISLFNTVEYVVTLSRLERLYENEYWLDNLLVPG